MLKLKLISARKLLNIITIIQLSVYSTLSFAERDPASKAASEMQKIMFGTLGSSLAAILIGATFIMAKAGKITWDRFIFIGLCTAGFLASPKLVGMIQGWVN